MNLGNPPTVPKETSLSDYNELDQNRPTFMTITEFARYAHLGRTFIYELISRGEIMTVKIGRRRFIPNEAAEAWRERVIARAATAA